MTVGELIEKLKECPSDKEVLTSHLFYDDEGAEYIKTFEPIVYDRHDKVLLA